VAHAAVLRRRAAGLFVPLAAWLAPGWALAHLPASDPCFASAGERWAERHLVRLGWRLLGRRVRTAWAEIDLLFAAQGALVVVEVKTGRSGPRFQPGQRLGRDALDRLWRAAHALARGAPARVDLVEVRLRRHGVDLVHHEGLRAPL
jgi:putative endonuclease